MDENANAKFQKIKEALIAFLRSLADRNKSLISITPVGSHAGPKEVEAMNDIDVVLVFDRLTKEKWDAILAELHEFAATHSDVQFGIVVETKFGPFKTASDRPITIQIHALFFDAESIGEYAKMSPLVFWDWYRFAPLAGSALSKLVSLPPFTAADIIKARGGIEYSLEQLADGVNIAVVLDFDDAGKLAKSIKKFPQNNEQKAETCFKSVQNTLLNIWKLESKKNARATDEELDALGEKILGKDGVLEMKSLEALYRRARAGENVTDAEIAASQQKAREILTLLKEYLSK